MRLMILFFAFFIGNHSVRATEKEAHEALEEYCALVKRAAAEEAQKTADLVAKKQRDQFLFSSWLFDSRITHRTPRLLAVNARPEFFCREVAEGYFKNKNGYSTPSHIRYARTLQEAIQEHGRLIPLKVNKREALKEASKKYGVSFTMPTGFYFLEPRTKKFLGFVNFLESRKRGWFTPKVYIVQEFWGQGYPDAIFEMLNLFEADANGRIMLSGQNDSKAHWDVIENSYRYHELARVPSKEEIHKMLYHLAGYVTFMGLYEMEMLIKNTDSAFPEIEHSFAHSRDLSDTESDSDNLPDLESDGLFDEFREGTNLVFGYDPFDDGVNSEDELLDDCAEFDELFPTESDSQPPAAAELNFP